MNARFLLVGTLSLAAFGSIASMAGCTIKSNDSDDGGTSSSSSSSSSGSSGTDGGLDSGAKSDAGDGGECLGSKEQGPLCHKDETPEAPAKCADECDTASTLFSSDIALAISSCIDDAVGNESPTPQLCEEVAPPCVQQATALACSSDNGVDSFCATVVEKCPDKGTANVITKTECLSYFKGATTSGRALLFDCLDVEKDDPNVCKICMDAVKSVHKGAD